ncbi:Translation initiation factor IF-3, chloroplastic [Apostasia shenzhenica]|uniref:Translation initiation factor IF-3, chloroplastic n=1 Tax=Apostasia shenzhenica TaxID=1088818 RepID=A0A2I0AQ04_9ASPA|nr:Translation initiation factor IF-3, chloroplastic [Apostasia shenzhenica]
MAGISGLCSSPASKLAFASGGSSLAKPLLSSSCCPPSCMLRLREGLLPRSVTRIATARLGGGFYRASSSGGSRRNPGSGRVDTDYDPALDLERVKSATVRLLDEQQNMVGVVPITEALQMAEEADLLLAILSADADPPVLRLFESADYKKHKYEQQKKRRAQLKRSAANQMDIKELKMGYNIDSHDYSVRLRAARKFLKDGDKVKVIVNLKGRENEFRNIAIELIKRFQNDVGELAAEESKSFRDRNIFMVLTPNKAALQAAQEHSKKKETPATEVSARA